MAEVIFNHEGIKTNIQCNINDKISDIIEKFLLTTKKINEKNKFNYFYSDKIINTESIFNTQANEIVKIKRK